jgi:formiminoglutamate deiminase
MTGPDRQRGLDPGPSHGVYPAFANCHSHAFHRALRGRAVGGTDFWGWRRSMYAVAGALDPDLYFRLARATYAEMALAGIGAVGEFHYLHHAPGGLPYADPHAMADAVIAAAWEVGLRICLLDTCYLRAGFGDEELHPVQRRFTYPDAERWAVGVAELAGRYAGNPAVVVGTAIHSVRAVGEGALATVAAALPDAPLHVHVSEQPAENDACLAATGRTPVALLADAGVWGPRTTAVHATHLTGDDIAILGAAGAFACFCPTTEAELADGIGPSVPLRHAGVTITLGSDSNTVIDMFTEARGLAMHERLATGRREGWSAEQLWQAATTDGAASMGFGGLGGFELAPSVRTAGGTDPIWAATAADVRSPADLDPGWVRAELATVIDEIWSRL